MRHVVDIEVEDTHCFFANGILTSNCQDIDRDHLPIIRETMSGSRYGGIESFSGTPKSLENTIAGLWNDSSQAEWVIRCDCGYFNVPALSHDLDRMIGPYRDDICEARPGVICAKCQKPINPRTGRWIHAYPERRQNFVGRHVPQIIMPMHYADPEKWSALLAKREGKGNTPVNVFYNEVCGESYDTGSRLVTLTELRHAANLPWERSIDAALEHLDEYTYRVLACDWGGGGEEEVSFTAMAVLGITGRGEIHVIWGHRSLTPHDHVREAKLCLNAMLKFKCHAFAHDYTGAGSLRETLINQAGIPTDRIIPIAYVRAAATAKVMTYKPATKLNPRPYYQVDKTRSLLLTCNQIKNGGLRFFKFDYENSENTGLIYDFLGLVDEKVDSRIGKDVYTIIRDPNMRDDFAQATNIGCCTLWHMTNKWPNIAAVAAMRVDPAFYRKIEPTNQDFKVAMLPTA